MKLYIVSGLGADFKVLEKIKFPAHLQIVFLDWLIPEANESFEMYVKRMASRIDENDEFALLGYSFGGIIVQEISKLKHAQKIVILGSIKSHTEKSKLLKAGEISGLPKYFPQNLFTEKPAKLYAFARRFFDSENPKILHYFRVKDPYYLKWSIEKIAAWKTDPIPGVIQIMGDKDIVFPLKNSRPEYVVKNGTHLFPATKAKEISGILAEIFS